MYNNTHTHIHTICRTKRRNRHDHVQSVEKLLYATGGEKRRRVEKKKERPKSITTKDSTQRYQTSSHVIKEFPRKIDTGGKN